MTRYVVIGNGVAGVTAAQTITRSEGEADLHIYADEPYPYYRRPLLPDFIAGEAQKKDIIFRPPEWYEERGITVHLDCRVAELDTSAHRIGLEDGSSAPYDRLLVATGGWAWMPPVEGADLGGVFTLRTLDDARAIREQAVQAQRAVVIGGGLLGLEDARALGALDVEVTVLEIMDHLLPRQLDEEGAEVLREILEQKGVSTYTGVVAEAILGEGSVSSVRIKDGLELPADLVVCSAGWRCEVSLARQAGLEVARGIVVDEHLQTSAEDVYAAGDVAEARGELYGIVPAAIEQARVAAANMIAPGSETYKGTLPFTTLKVAGAELTSIGEHIAEDSEAHVLRQVDMEGPNYRKLVLREGRISGAIMLNDRARSLAVRRLIQEQVDVSGEIDRLLDDDFDLNSLL